VAGVWRWLALGLGRNLRGPKNRAYLSCSRSNRALRTPRLRATQIKAPSPYRLMNLQARLPFFGTSRPGHRPNPFVMRERTPAVSPAPRGPRRRRVSHMRSSQPIRRYKRPIPGSLTRLGGIVDSVHPRPSSLGNVGCAPARNNRALPIFHHRAALRAGQVLDGGEAFQNRG